MSNMCCSILNLIHTGPQMQTHHFIHKTSKTMDSFNLPCILLLLFSTIVDRIIGPVSNRLSGDFLSLLGKSLNADKWSILDLINTGPLMQIHLFLPKSSETMDSFNLPDTLFPSAFIIFKTVFIFNSETGELSVD